jgi:hypothetical protein
MPRQYVINCINTLIGTPFEAWVDKRMTERNQKLATEHNLNIKLDPRIASAFAASTAVSCKY